MPATALLPSLSEIDAWDTAHLDAAADDWTTTAHTWEDAFTTVYRQAQCPGGTPWEGEAADAALLRLGSDRLTVLAAVDTLHAAAGVARDGAADIRAARDVAIEAIGHARAAGFTVGEDLSVTSRHTEGPPALHAMRQAQAEVLATKIHIRAAALAAADELTAGRLATTMASLRTTEFAPVPVAPRVQAVDNHTFRQSPIPEPGTPDEPGVTGPVPPIRTGEDVKRVLDTLEPGENPGVVTLETPDEIRRLFDDLTRTAVEAPHPTYDGPRRALPDGTTIGLRPSSGWGGPTIDVVYPDGTDQAVHLPIVTAAPELPLLADPPPVALPPTQATHPPVTAVPPMVVTTPLLPPWLQDQSPPGFQVIPREPLIMPWDWAMSPVTTAPPAPELSPQAPLGPSITLPHLPPLSADYAGQVGAASTEAGSLAAALALLALLMLNPA